MSNTLIATLGGLWALAFWGVGDWLLARSSKKSDAFEVNAAFNLPGVLIMAAVVLITRQHINSFHNIWILTIASLLFSAAFLAFIRALATGATGIVTPASSTFPLFTLILTAIFLTLTFSHLQILAMLIVVAGVIMLAFEKRDKTISLRAQHTATILALTAAFLWGVGNVVQNAVINKESWQIVLLTIEVPITIVSLILLVFIGKQGIRKKVRRVRANKTALIAGTTYSIGSWGFYYTSVRVGSILIPLIVASASPLVTCALSAYVDKERLTILRRAGAVVVVAGIILINI